MNESKRVSRRRFITIAAGAAATLPLASLMSALPAHASDLPQLAEDDAQAAALGYRHDATTVDTGKFPKRTGDAGATQFCDNCQLYQAAEDGWGGCAILRQLGDELAEVLTGERLRQRCVDAQALRDLVPCGAGAQHDHRDFDISPATAKLAQEHLAVLDRQHQVDDHQIRQLDLALCERRPDVGGSDDAVPILREHDFEHVTKRRIVI